MPAIFITIFAWIIGVVIALYLGTSLGDSDYLTAILAGLLCAGVAFVCWLHKYTLLLALAIVFFSFSFYTFGFAIAPEQLIYIFGVALVCMYIWQPEKLDLPPALQTKAFKVLKLSVVLWCIYASTHAFFHLLQTYLSHDPGLKNIIKSYFNYTVPYLLLAFFLFQPQRLQVSKRILLWIVGICFTALVVNVILRFHQQMYGIRMQYTEDAVPEPFYIPYINLVESIYALRGLGPFSALLGVIIFTSRAWNRGKLFMYLIGLLLIPIGVFGSMVSGGRASAIMCIVFSFLVIIFRKKYTLLLSLILFASIFIGIANVYADTINNKLPFFMSRSIQLVVIKKKQEAFGSIEDSSRWRNELHMMALQEWIKNPKNLIIGRGFLGLQEGEDWYTAVSSEDQSKYMQDLALRRVATHAMLTDLLLGFGIIGAIIYYFFLFSMTYFCWVTYKTLKISETARDIALILITCSFSYIPLATYAGGILGSIEMWLLITLCASLQTHPFDPTLPEVQKDLEQELTLQEKLKKASLRNQSPL